MFSIGTGEIMVLLLSKASQSPVTFSSLDYSAGYRWSPRCSQCPLHLVLQIAIRSKRAVLQGESPIFFRGPLLSLSPYNRVHMFPIHFLSHPGFLDIASKQDTATSLAFSGSFPGKLQLTLLSLSLLCLYVIFPPARHVLQSLEDSVHTSTPHRISHH